MATDYPVVPRDEVRLDGVTELRVHGVGGTPPEALLNEEHPVRVSGDRHAGFYRRREELQVNPRVEAFSWGGLTAGGGTRALWLLLLPFALVNLAGWMHAANESDKSGTPNETDVPKGEYWDQRTSAPVAKALVRLFSVTITSMLVLFVSAVALDLVGYQCAGVFECQHAQSWMFLFDWLGGPAASPARRLALASLIPLAALLAVYIAGLFSYRQLEAFEPGYVDPSTGQQPEIGLRNKHFWRGGTPVWRLRRLHLAAGSFTLTIALSAAFNSIYNSPPELGTIARGVNWVLLLLAMAGLIAVGVVVCIPALYSHTAAQPLDPVGHKLRVRFDRVSRWLAVGSGILYALAVLLLVVPKPWRVRQPDSFFPLSPPTLHNLNRVSLTLMVVQALLLLGLLVWGRGSRESFWGQGPAIVCAVAWFLVVSAWAGVGIRIHDTLEAPLVERLEATARFGDLSPPQLRAEVEEVHETVRSPQWGLQYPDWYRTAALAFLVAVLLGVLAAICCAAWIILKAKDHEADVQSRIPKRWVLLPTDKDRIANTARWYVLSKLVSQADKILGAIVIVPVLVSVVVVVTGVDLQSLPTWLFSAAAWTVTLLPLLAALLLSAAYRSPSARRAVGVAWDVLTFWPRLNHPFSPPCYGERAVPQLYTRLMHLSSGESGTQEIGRILLSAHSQGTVVSAAALLQLDRTTKRRVVFCTYGSPLVLLYRRAFPAYFGGGILRRLGEELPPPAGSGATSPRWQHFWCKTDPLGVPMFDNPPDKPEGQYEAEMLDEELLDPHTWDYPVGEPPPPVLAHSAYWSHPKWHEWGKDTCGKLAEELCRRQSPEDAGERA